MPLKPGWLHMLRARLLDDGEAPATRFLQLATLTVAGRASVRTVVFRGWHEDEEGYENVAMKIVTDKRSDKIEGLRKCPWAEACWYFVEARQQYRLTGRVTLIDASEQDSVLQRARVDQWRALSDSARLQFRYPAPGQDRATQGESATLFQPEPASATTPEDSFVLLLLHPSNVDVVDLRANERRAFVLEDGGSWRDSFINP